MHASGNQSLLIVTGMHRSGTSALCAALAACGVSFGERLIEAMAGVNDEGFWEDARVVALNEQLLALTDSTWYAPAPGLAGIDWTQECFQDLRQQAAALLEAGFGESAWGAVKDPRFCLTLRFWLDVGNDLGLATRVCAIGRVPLEVARSLQRRDGFPPGYGLRLCSAYRGLLLAALPADALQVDYDALLADTPYEQLTLSAVARAALPTLPGTPADASPSRPRRRPSPPDLPYSRSHTHPTRLTRVGRRVSANIATGSAAP